MQALKINAKINGINQKLQAAPFAWMNEPYIVMGKNMCTKQAIEYTGQLHATCAACPLGKRTLLLAASTGCSASL